MIFLLGSAAGVILALFAFGIYYRKSSGVCLCKDRLDGKTVILTESTKGTSKVVAIDLASRGGKVVLACKDVNNGEALKDEIILRTRNENLEVCHLDFSDLYSEKTSYEEELTNEGFEMTIVQIILVHFFLRIFLLSKMLSTGKCRIINVSSVAHKFFHLNLDDVHFKKRRYNVWASFCQASLCSLLFTKELFRRLVGKGVTANTLHTGLVSEEVLTEKSIFSSFFNAIGSVIFKTPYLGAQSIIHLAVSEKLDRVTGEYFIDCKIDEPSKKALDPRLARQLWEFTEEEIGLRRDQKNTMNNF
ncbi:hypothetical protein Anas_00090 [Armadillidium nasatum]|uniref:Retinol dehydrogenase 13 n=1 Tax=Armadillidium nasatum TaxID=96803 RepID=A0A5N5SWD3_9CRUS|nr:hypothetical protein Anas_00090 [Armadillidium nasatum]